MRRSLVLIAVLVFLAVMPAGAESGSCSAASPFASSLGGSWLGGCDGRAACGSTATSCVMRVTSEVRGVGVVSVKMIVDGQERARCAYGVGSCATTALMRIAAGDRVPVASRFVDGAAIDVRLSCVCMVRS
jgi:hypothetical protein